jgi:hypothetical protein
VEKSREPLTWKLQNNPLDLIERYFIIPPIILLRRPRTFMRRHLLRMFEHRRLGALFDVGLRPEGAERQRNRLKGRVLA